MPQNMNIIEDATSRRDSRKDVLALPVGNEKSIESIRKSGGWPAEILRKSHEMNSSRFGSKVFKSLWKTQNMSSLPA